MRTFKFDRDPYGFVMYRKSRLTLEPGVTILIGCNGAGKTTMLHCLEGELKRKDIPTLLFSNLRDGGKQSISVLLESRRNNLAASMATASEGEGILISLGRLLETVRGFLSTGKDAMHQSDFLDFIAAWNNDSDGDFEQKKKAIADRRKECKERWILIDGCDSGYSIDNIVDLKELFPLIMADAEKEGKDLYIVISANSYELASGERCYDVSTGTFCKPKTYKSYRKRILASRERKNGRVMEEDNDED